MSGTCCSPDGQQDLRECLRSSHYPLNLLKSCCDLTAGIWKGKQDNALNEQFQKNTSTESHYAFLNITLAGNSILLLTKPRAWLISFPFPQNRGPEAVRWFRGHGAEESRCQKAEPFSHLKNQGFRQEKPLSSQWLRHLQILTFGKLFNWLLLKLPRRRIPRAQTMGSSGRQFRRWRERPNWKAWMEKGKATPRSRGTPSLT